MKKIGWKTETRKVAELVPADYNPRKLSAKAREELQQSIRQFGEVEPVVVNTDGTIIGGHQRVSIYADLGIDEITVRVPSRKLTLEEEQELNLRLNKNVGEWDLGMLAEMDRKLLEGVGFGADELAKIFDADKVVQEDDFDVDAELAAIKKAKTKPGDIYLLGKHRLICGDSAQQETYEKLMEGVKADMCWTDPPYNVEYDYQTKYGDRPGQRKKQHKGGSEVFSDGKSKEEYLEFLTQVFTNVFANTRDAMGFYISYPTRWQREYLEAFERAGFHFSQIIIWLKERLILSRGQDFHRIYEPIIYGWKEGRKHWVSKADGSATEVWDLDKMTFEERLDVWYLTRDKAAEYQHPTQKPVRLPERAIKKSCPVGGIALEPFGGSGSTLLACEQLDRACYTIELDPRYCDVIVKRWEQYTGRKAKKK